ncbi:MULTISPECIES: nuclear transport factor 2 family protein [Actinoalloteichus]|nr:MULTISPECIES: nuclear transport factor 2 family protein [Actinoalloteichus]
MTVLQELLAVERRLAHGSGEDYAAVLHEDALVIVPGAVLDKAQCIDAMNSSPGWDETSFTDERLVETEHTATVVYTFAGRRGASTYTATLASTYLRHGDGGRLLVHQQTPA